MQLPLPGETFTYPKGEKAIIVMSSFMQFVTGDWAGKDLFIIALFDDPGYSILIGPAETWPMEWETAAIASQFGKAVDKYIELGGG